MEPIQLICDFVNTADLESGTDQLVDTRTLQYWLVFHELADLSHRASRSDLDDAIAVREALRELLRAHTGVEVDRETASATLEAAARRAGVTITFVDGAARIVGGERPLGGLLAAVAQTMSDGSWQRLKACRSDTCRWAFVDRARNRSRQWCDMSVCGNREKARAFRRRHA